MAVTGASLSEIYDRLNRSSQTRPMSANTFADWSLEAGDKVIVTRDGQNYESTVHNSSMSWKGKTPTVEINSTGNEKRDAVSKVSQRKYNRGSGGMRNQEEMYNDIWSEDGHVHSVIQQTASSINEYVEDLYRQMSAGLALTSSSAALYVRDMYNQMSSGLALTSSSAALYVRNMYTQMSAGLNLTSSSAALYVRDMYNQMASGLNLTSSSAALYVRDMYNQMSSGLNLTSSSAAVYVRNMYTQMVAGLNLTSSSAALYAQNRSTRAYIMARINANNEGEALISADKVSISGTTRINDVMTITDSKLHVTTGARINGNVMAQSLTLRDGSSDGTLTAAQFEGVIKSASVNGFTLTLTPVKGNAITFSKAVTSVNESWSNGMLTVTPQPQNQNFVLGTLSQGTTSWNTNTATVPVNFLWGSSQQYTESTGKNIIVDASGRYNAGRAAVTLNEPTWNTVSSLGTSRTVTVSTTGRTNASGTTENLSKSVPLYLTKNNLTVSMRAGSEDGTIYALATCSDSNLKAKNIKKDVEIFGVTGTYEGTSYTGKTLRCTSKEQTYPGSTTYYYYFRLEGNYGFSTNTNYTFYRESWPT